MKNVYRLMLALSLMGLLGCGDRGKSEAEKVAQTARQAFDTAPEPLKTKFQELRAAIEANDFPKAKAGLDQLQLLQTQMSPEQQLAVTEQKQTLLLKASAAAQNGDANALQLIQAVRAQSRSR